MSPTCPDCGSELEVQTDDEGSAHTSCPDCGYTSTPDVDVEETPGSEGPERPEGADGADDEDEGDEEEEGEEPSERRRPPRGPRPQFGGNRAAGPTRGCRKCGEPLTYSENDQGNVEGSCSSCGGTFTFVIEGEGGGRPFRPRSFGGPRFQDRGRGGAPQERRGCRECGAPLEFTSNEDGSVTGACTSCSNKFTLPPRRDGGGYRGGGGGFRGGGNRFGGRPRRPYGGGGGGGDRGGSRRPSDRGWAPREDRRGGGGGGGGYRSRSYGDSGGSAPPWVNKRKPNRRPRDEDQ